MSSTSSRVVRVATRQSPLALWQAEHIASLLAAGGVRTELVPLTSGGDTDMRPIDATRQVGLFTKRIQQAVIDGEADLAVHSLKDLPTEPDPRLVLAAVPQRETVADCLVSPAGWSLQQLPDRAQVGTGSRRRAAQLLSVRPDLRVVPIRGNVQTRLEKLESGPFDAIVLAEAGLLRLGLDGLPRHRLTLAEMLPAPGQGALGIEVRADDRETRRQVAKLDDPASRLAVTAERTLLAALHGGCLAPIAALATVREARLSITAAVLSSDGGKRIDETMERVLEEQASLQIAESLALSLSERLIEAGARELIESTRANEVD